MELPIDHFRLLGVSPAIDAQSVLRTLQQRLDRPPEDGFTDEALEARAHLLRESADLLSNDKRRQRYESELTAVIRGEPGVIPALVIASSREVGGLILLWEAGLGLQAFELASRSLQPPRAPALGSGRESDLALVAGLASRQAAQDDQQERHYERAAEILLKGQQLLQRMGQHHELRQELARERDALLPYRVLQLLSRPGVHERREGLALLDKLVERRHGLDGDADPDFARPAFEAFLGQIRSYLTVQEQIDLFDSWAQGGSQRADVLAAMALAASGFAQRKPQRIARALERLQTIDASGLAMPVACLTLLLGQVEEAQTLFQGIEASATDGSDRPRRWPEGSGSATAAAEASSPLAKLCHACVDWLRDEVLPGYRDVEIDADLEAWFADRDVQNYVEQQDRRLGRRRVTQPPAASPEPQATTPPPFLDTPQGLEPATATGLTDGFGMHSAPDLDREDDDEEPDDEDDLWDDERDPVDHWHWPELPSLNLTALKLPALSLERLKPLHWVAIGGGVAVAATLLWSLRPKPQTLPVQPLVPPPTLAPPPTSAVPVPPAAAPPQTPPAPIADAPLQASTPSEAQIRQLLDRWLEAKTRVMAGDAPPESLAELATPTQLDRLKRSRAADEQAGHRMAIDATVTDLRIIPIDTRTIEARAGILYSDKLLDRNHRVISTDPPKTLRNTYVFGRGSDGLWRLTDFRPGS